jgi:hypothetical protein
MPLPKQGANLKGRRNHSGNEWQWAAAVVRKATPRIIESLIEAAASLSEGRQTSAGKPASRGPDEVEDESLAALLLRLLRTPETGENSDAAANTMTSASQNPSVG